MGTYFYIFIQQLTTQLFRFHASKNTRFFFCDNINPHFHTTFIITIFKQLYPKMKTSHLFVVSMIQEQPNILASAHTDYYHPHSNMGLKTLCQNATGHPSINPNT